MITTTLHKKIFVLAITNMKYSSLVGILSERLYLQDGRVGHALSIPNAFIIVTSRGHETNYWLSCNLIGLYIESARDADQTLPCLR